MEPTLFKFVWRFSRLQQLAALGLALALFPLQYLALEIPKVIINDAIGVTGAAGSDADARTAELLWLCGAFLVVVVAAGLMKMAMNLYKGRIGERLIRRLRFTLIDRMIHFPLPEFRRTSQGEVVSMVTSEVEPLGGVMSEVVAQPVFLAGQMLTILAFLFFQSVWLGLASIAFIPLQAYLIPLLQRQVNKLQRERIGEVRRLSQELGDTFAAVEDLRANNGVRRREAAFSNRLGRIFNIRLRIYRKKYFMKFLNNFINQITPLLYFSIGGWLVIRGELTVGALVAALAAYKDLANPWKELLAYVNQLQEMNTRYLAVMERFSPAGLAATPTEARAAAAERDELAGAARRAQAWAARTSAAFTRAGDRIGRAGKDIAHRLSAAAALGLEGRGAEAVRTLRRAAPADGAADVAPAPEAPASTASTHIAHDQPAIPKTTAISPAPHLNGTIRLENVALGAVGDSAVLQGVSAEFPAGGTIAVTGGDAMVRAALAQALARMTPLENGSIHIGDLALADAPASAATARIGYIASEPKLFEATIWDNIRSSFAAEPAAPDCAARQSDRSAERCEQEAAATGNSLDAFEGRWHNPALETPHDDDSLRAAWIEMIDRFGYENAVARRGLEIPLDPQANPELAQQIVALRPRIAAQLRAEGLGDAARRFDPKGFNPGLTIVENLVFGAKRPALAMSEHIDRRLLACAERLGLSAQLQEVARDFLTVLTRAFRGVAPDHRLFARLGGVSAELLTRLERLDYKLNRCGPAPKLSNDDLVLLQELLFRTTPEQIGARLPKAFRNRILAERHANGPRLLEEMSDLFAPIAPDAYIAPLSPLENALYGHLPLRSSTETQRVREIVLEVAEAEGLGGALTHHAGAAPVGANGADLTPRMRERIALGRALIKRPDIVIFEDALRSHSAEERSKLLRETRAMLPDATLIILDEEAPDAGGYDASFEISNETLRRIDVDAESSEPQPIDARAALAAPAAIRLERQDIEDATGSEELTKRIRILARSQMFRGLARAQLRLLGFASEFVEAQAGEKIFAHGDMPDGAYILDSGLAELRWPEGDGPTEAVTLVEPGRVIGDLSVLRAEPRTLDFVAVTDVRGLKIGAEEFMDVIRSDRDAAMHMLMAISGNLMRASQRLRATRLENEELREDAATRDGVLGGGALLGAEVATRPIR
ncbi:MAG: ABC transporter transmembrane domain-containing protein [Neomegalonema sp.]|nr:ABC transporter transmembrane domain-containing protein [Neomegalonema sp.]